MNKQILKKILQREGIREDCYDLDGGLPSESYALEEETGGWCVYHSERGLQSGKRHFPTESEACVYLLAELRSAVHFFSTRPNPT